MISLFKSCTNFTTGLGCGWDLVNNKCTSEGATVKNVNQCPKVVDLEPVSFYFISFSAFN